MYSYIYHSIRSNLAYDVVLRTSPHSGLSFGCHADGTLKMTSGSHLEEVLLLAEASGAGGAGGLCRRKDT